MAVIADEPAFGAADSWPAQFHPHMAGQAESPRMGPALTVDYQHIRGDFELFNSRNDSRPGI